MQYWDKQPHTIVADPDDWEWQKELPHRPPWREQLMAELDGRPPGFMQTINFAKKETYY